MEALTHNNINRSMIDMNDVSLALKLVKADRVGSTASLSSSWTTCRSGSSSSSDSSGSGCEDGGDPRRKSNVRWRDEEGGELVSEVRRTPNFWEEMVFGSEDDDAAAAAPPSDLCRFISELTRGVEATVVFSGLTKKRRRVVLFTDDNGVSISWLVSGSPKQPYRIRCETLLEVTPKFAKKASCGGADCCCDIGLRWLPQPTWAKRSAKLVDIATESPAVFASGMRQLLSFNTTLQS